MPENDGQNNLTEGATPQKMIEKIMRGKKFIRGNNMEKQTLNYENLVRLIQ